MKQGSTSGDAPIPQPGASDAEVKAPPLQADPTDDDLQAAIVRGKSLLSRLIEGDFSVDHSLSHLDTALSYESEGGIRIYLRRFDGVVLELNLLKSATVLDLKRAAERSINKLAEGTMGARRISWRYVWRQWQLSANGKTLLADRDHLQVYGVTDRSEVQFMRIDRPNKRQKRRA